MRLSSASCAPEGWTKITDPNFVRRPEGILLAGSGSAVAVAGAFDSHGHQAVLPQKVMKLGAVPDSPCCARGPQSLIL